jgi:hypothetical protein
MPFRWRKSDIGGKIFSSDPLTVKPRSRKAAATEPIAVPQMPRKWKWRGSPITRISLR